MKRLFTAASIFLATTICYAGEVQDSGIKGGIVVHLNCGDGKATIELAADNNCLVHGLDTDAANVNKARSYLQSKNLYDRVSVARYDGKALPYADNMINLIVADKLGGVPQQEVMRVLVPKGIALIGGKKTVKPWPENIDTWPQYLNKADNNAVAMDSVVGPPRRIQWKNTPTWSRSHMAIATVASVVTCNGRLFSIEDRALPDNPYLPGRFFYVARDAFNGRTLWMRKIDRWESITTYIKCMPTQQQRRMVATDDILYCTPVLEGPLVALDAATGKTLKTYDAFSPVQEVSYDGGILFVNVGERFNAAAYNQTHKKSDGKGGTSGEPFNGSGFRKGYAKEIIDKQKPVSMIVAIDPKSGGKLWQTERLTNYTGASFAVKGNRAVYQTGDGLFCIDPKTGAVIWSAKKSVTNLSGHDSNTPGTMPNTVIITEDKAFAVEGKQLFAYSLKDGKALWNIPVASNYESSADVFYVNGTLWIGGTKNVTGHDPQTGKQRTAIPQRVTGPMSHDRCYRNMITKRYYINSKTGGADFLDLESKKEYPNHWTRGTCGFGVLPANGLLYSTPYSCTCSVGSMMRGMNAYRADPQLIKSNDSSLIKRTARLEKGDAYGKIASAAPAADDAWPTYRGNRFRAGITKSPVPSKLNVKWQVKLPANPTTTTIAGGNVYVCTPETHTLHALDCTSGKTAWTFTADGRIDSPPTYYKGTVLFGSRDGWIYCVRATDGVLAWRFKDLPDRLVGAFGQLESAWPVHGSVLVLDDKVYAAAGLSSYLDGGIFLYCLDPATGECQKNRSSYGPFAKGTGFPIGFKATGSSGKGGGGKKRKGKGKGKQPKTLGSATRVQAGFRNDLLVSDGTDIFIRHRVFGKDLTDSGSSTPHLMPLSGFLDRRVQHRTGFVLNNKFVWWANNPKDIMISDGQETYAVAGFQSPHNHAYFDPRTGSYTLHGTGNLKVALPINGRALSKAADVIFVAGEQMKFPSPSWQKYEDAYTGKSGGQLLALSANGGKTLATYKLSAAPVWDSIALAGGCLYISLEDGTIQCMGK